MINIVLLAILLAQSPSDLPGRWSDWAELGALLSGFAALMVFMRHMVFVVMPSREKECREERAALMKAHQEILDKVSATFEKHTEQCDKRCEERHKEILEELGKIREKMHNHSGALQAAINQIERNSKG